MSFTPLMMKLTVLTLDELPPSPCVLELGNQTFDPTLRMSNTAPEDEMMPLIIRHLDRSARVYDREVLARLRGLDPEQAKPHTATYYKAVGYRDYAAIDVNSNYGSLVMDLNHDLGERYGFRQQFDLVTNNGTGEHIFNQFAVFKNMHDLCKQGGLMLFVLPFYNWLNHGFYSFHPVLFADLAAANQYEIVRMSVAANIGNELEASIEGKVTGAIRFSWEPKYPRLTVQDFQRRGAIGSYTFRSLLWRAMRCVIGKPPRRQIARLPGGIRRLAERTPNVNIVVALRKTQAADFKPPLQGMYAGDNVEDVAIATEYGKSPRQGGERKA